MEKPPNTPEMSVHDAEAMVDSILRDSPLPDPVRAMRKSRKVTGAANFQKGEKEKSFLREVLMNSPRRPLQVSL